MSKISINHQDLYHSYLESKLLGKIKHKTSPRLTAPLSLIRRGAGGEVHLLHQLKLR